MHHHVGVSLNNELLTLWVETVVDQLAQHPKLWSMKYPFCAASVVSGTCSRSRRDSKRVTFTVLVRLHGQNADLFPTGLGVEEEQHPVQVRQRLDRQLSGEVVVAEQQPAWQPSADTRRTRWPAVRRPAATRTSDRWRRQRRACGSSRPACRAGRAIVGAECVTREKCRSGLQGVGLLRPSSSSTSKSRYLPWPHLCRSARMIRPPARRSPTEVAAFDGR